MNKEMLIIIAILFFVLLWGMNWRVEESFSVGGCDIEYTKCKFYNCFSPGSFPYRIFNKNTATAECERKSSLPKTCKEDTVYCYKGS